MSQRVRACRTRQHVHCDSCYSRRCRARAEASVCCALASCRLLCGAVFHLCKEEEHLLLCPNVRVPCLNAAYGCPLQLPRCSRAAHLHLCPASVVSCSMDWLRWPAHDAHSHPNTELHDNLLRERDTGGCLDLAMALKDQDLLFHSLKMKKLFPEMIQSVQEEEEEERREQEERRKEKLRKKKEAAEKAARDAAAKTWETFDMFNLQKEKEEEEEEEEEVEQEQELTQEEREAIARDMEVNANLLENYNAWERMFSMEMGGCRQAGAAAGGGAAGGGGGGGPAAGGGGAARGGGGGGGGLDTVQEEEEAADTCVGASCRQGSSSSSSSSCARRNMEFVYGHVEPMKIITVRTFKTPTSFSAKQSRIRNPGFYKRESRAVDTRDLGVEPQQIPVWEEVQASLLCSLEKEQRGHLIAEAACSDGLLVDEGTQTYSFLSAPFRSATSLADLTAPKPLELHLQLQVESVTSRHHKASSAFTFLCGHSFQRREYGTHYKNVHSDIQMGVNGWFEQRCPLAYLGCTYSQRRFQPSTNEAAVHFNEELGCFSLHPSVPVSTDSSSGGARRQRGGEDPLSSLPYEVLCHMASFLDSLSLSQLALVSRLMRQVSSSLLQERGMVFLHWERSATPKGGATWRVTHTVWQFSSLFSPVDSWCFQNVPSMSEHLKVCPFYELESRTEKIHLPRVKETTKKSCKGPTLVSTFQQKRIMM